MKLFFSVGEPSGDLHGANLIRQLKRRRGDIECVGYGGPKMQEAGCDLHTDLTALAVMWFLRVLLNIDKFLKLLAAADRYFREHRPDGVVLIDYPGFNWWIARRAKARGIPVFYYTPPQIWAWGSWRVGKMRRFVDHVLCSLPFEVNWFRDRGCNATFLGHPFFDEVRRHRFDEAFCERLLADERPVVGILPGSRTQEVTHNLPWFLKAAEAVQRKMPRAKFVVASFKPHQADIAKRMIAEHARASGYKLDIEIQIGRTPEVIHVATCCMAVSGSVSLELLYHVKPTVILYWVSKTGYFVQSLFRRVKYITLVNLLSTDELFPKDTTPYDPTTDKSGKVLFPEYLTYEDKSQQIAGHVVEWLVNEQARERTVERLAELRNRVAAGGASGAAAEYIVAELEVRKNRKPRPHFVPTERDLVSVGEARDARGAAA